MEHLKKVRNVHVRGRSAVVSMKEPKPTDKSRVLTDDIVHKIQESIGYLPDQSRLFQDLIMLMIINKAKETEYCRSNIYILISNAKPKIKRDEAFGGVKRALESTQNAHM